MAYTDDAVLSKLSALNESHESIATTAQWIMFHRRHAPQSIHLWSTKLKDLASPKRLNMIYLANGIDALPGGKVVQQSKARQKDDFVKAFSPVIVDATAVAYKGASADIQAKLKRVVEVWRDRGIFDKEILEAIETRFTELDKARNSAKISSFGNSIFGAAGSSSSAVPSELASLTAPQQEVAKSLGAMNAAVSIANTDQEKVMSATAETPAPPVYAARLNGLLKSLATAEGAVLKCIKARTELIEALENVLTSNRRALTEEQTNLADVQHRKTRVESRKNEVEMDILAAYRSTAGDGLSEMTISEPDRPVVEALTPPHVQDHDDDSSQVAELNFEGMQVPTPMYAQQSNNSQKILSAPGMEMLSHLASQCHAVPVNGTSKKRKLEEEPDLGGDDGIDADVEEILRRDSRTS